MLEFEFMQRALLAALLVGVVAPMVGIFIVQRGLSMIGDALGHVALAGVGIGVVMNSQPVWAALVVAVLAALLIEALRARGGTGSDVVIALMLHTGIALGVVLMSSTSAAGSGGLESYLFGAITTTSRTDLVTFALLGLVVVVATTVLRPRLFAVAQDEEYSRAQGLPVTALNMLLSVLVAVTIVMSMRVVGLLLISALMVVPNAAAQRLTRGFAAAWWCAIAIGAVSGVGGVALSYQHDLPSGGTIVLLTVAVYAVVVLTTAVVHRIRVGRHRRARPGEHHEHEHHPDCGHTAVPHGDHVDYLHGDHLHHPHAGHYDERPLDDQEAR
ncbi:metal ABC transporter permease [Kytococcus sedentarius]|uniref:metal ABC transporter permease n=1 Tax=Kytococcus sedentarius TaxID=1276 RepID=UPI0035BC8295